MWIMFHKRCFGHIYYKIRSDHVTSRQFVVNLVLIVVGNVSGFIAIFAGCEADHPFHEPMLHRWTIPFMNLCCISGPSLS